VPTPADEEDGQRVIWGTNVSIADSMRRFREFLLGFQRKHRLRADNIPFDEGEGEEYTYVDVLKTVRLDKFWTDFRCVKLIFRP
jgi:DNA replication licensing factor MCM4